MKYAIFVKRLTLSNEMLEELNKTLTNDEKTLPGQLRKKDDWYVLTYLKVSKIRSYNANCWDMEEKEIDTIQAVMFKIDNNKIYIANNKSGLKEIESYFEAVALKLTGDQEVVNFNKIFSVDNIEIDLENILKGYEDKGVIEDVRKIRVKPMEVTLGIISNCVIRTNDYGGVRKVLENDNSIFGIEISLKNPAKTLVYYDIDGQVKVTTKGADNISEMVLQYSSVL